MFDYFKRRPEQPLAAPEASVPAQPVVPSAPPASPAPAGPTLKVGLAAVCEFWPEAIRREITRQNWSGAFIALPLDRLEAAIKTGRVVFTWGELVQWLDVSPVAGLLSSNETPLELPLKVMVPLFMPKLPSPPPRKKVAPSDKVPQLFAAGGA